MNSDTEFARGETPTDSDNHTVVAAFAEQATAKAAVQTLHDEGFHKTWIGVTRVDFELDRKADSGIITTKVDDDTIGSRIGRFFTGGTGGTTLSKALQHHGVSEGEAQRIDAALEPNDVLVTVNGSNHPELAAQLIEDAGGDLLSGGYQDADIYARELRLETGGRTRLRDERLNAAGVPVHREEFFVIAYNDDWDDESGIAKNDTAGVRAMGGSIGTTHHHEE
jgi:hypothetical protein